MQREVSVPVLYNLQASTPLPKPFLSYALGVLSLYHDHPCHPVGQRKFTRTVGQPGCCAVGGKLTRLLG